MSDIPRRPTAPGPAGPADATGPTAPTPDGDAKRAPRPGGRPALAGIVSVAAALGVSELIAGILPGATSLVAAIGQWIIDHQPPGAKDIVVSLFGTNDKLALEVVIVLVTLAIGAGIGIASVRRAWVGPVVFIVFGIVGFFAALGDVLATASIVAVEVLVAVGTGIQVLAILLARARVADTAAPPVTDPARRTFLLATSVIGIAAVVAGIGGRALVDRLRSAPVSSGPPIPPASEVAPPIPAGADLSAQVPGITPLVMPNDKFYRIDTSLLAPSVDTATWNLRVFGLVDREVNLSWADLLEFPMVEQYVTIACVSNEVGGNLVGNAKWTGVKLRDVLDMAGVQTSATQLVGRSVDGWTAGMPTAWVMDPDREPLIAVEMNDQPLPVAHGYPARLIVPGLYGYVSATKWLTELELTTLESFNGYWVPLGWAKEGPILTQSRIDTPRGGVQAGQVAVAGIAWAPDRGVSKVEVGVDGVWTPATVSQPISDATWVQWLFPWAATPGNHVLQVRATDATGTVQEEQPSPPAPDGARGWHTVNVHVG